MFNAIRVSNVRKSASNHPRDRWGPLRRIAVLTALLAALQVLPVEAGQGFGADTPGGIGKSVYRVTNLSDSGPGSLRDAVSKGGRYVVFDVAGTISLSSDVRVLGAYVTIDGSTAPSPGITLRGAGLDIDGNYGDIHDVVVHKIRIRDPQNDGIAVEWGAHHVLIDHVSVDGCGDGNIDITRYAHDVTVSWSVLSGCGKNMLIKYEAQRVSLHHNVFIHAQWRNPWISYTTEHTNNLSPDTMVDMRNNLVWGWGDSGGGTGIECGAKANLVNNYFSSPYATSASRQANAIIMKTSCSQGGYGAYAHTFGNVSADGLSFDLNSKGNVSSPFAAPFVDTHDACVGARDALSGAGVEPLDSVDLGHLSQVSLPSCGSSAPPPPAPEPTPEPTPEPAPEPTPAPASNPDPEEEPAPAPSVQLFSQQVSHGSNDAEELPGGRVETSYEPIRLGKSRDMTAFRFRDVTVPPGATIVSAKVRLYVVNNGSASVSYLYSGEKTASSRGIDESRRNLSGRAQTNAQVSETPPYWPKGDFAETAELASIVQEIVDQPDWRTGNPVTIFVTDAKSSEFRRIGSYESSPSQAAVLEVRWLP